MENIYTKAKDEKELKEMIDKRLETLYSNAGERKVLGYESVTPLKGIIPKETLIDNGDSYFKIENDEYLYEFMMLLKKHNMTEIGDAVRNLSSYLDYYFGKNGNEDIRRQILNENIDGDNYHDISILKGKNAAMCAERAAMAQNIFSFLGIESYYISGDIEVGEQKGPHAYNIIKLDEKMFLYDSTARVPIYKDGNYVASRHFIQEIDSKIGEEPKINTEIETEEYRLDVVANGFEQKKIGTRRYAIGVNVLKDKKNDMER
ncbi:MAG: hypothetical protein J6M60_01735 [Clostridia bacterium]|nr:hypothetical protein [Clostridia bacterium]